MAQQLGIIIGIGGFVICIVTALVLAIYASASKPNA